MIDCNKTENFIREKKRICQHYTNMGCKFCVLDRNIWGLTCSDFIMQHPKKAIEIVQQWSNETPPKTLLTEFLRNYPKTELNGMGIPNIAPCKLGLVELNSKCIENCVHQYCLGIPCKECWDTPIEESEETI